MEGTATTVKSDTKVQPLFHAFKITVNGKEIDLTADVGPGMMGGRDRNDQGRDQRGPGMMGGNGKGQGRW